MKSPFIFINVPDGVEKNKSLGSFDNAEVQAIKKFTAFWFKKITQIREKIEIKKDKDIAIITSSEEKK